MSAREVGGRWVPVLRGKVYCSPACGGGCTKAAHNRAWQDAAATVKKLGGGWMIRVWENLGWHFEVYRGCLKVHPQQRRVYKAAGRSVVEPGGTIYFDTPVQQFVARYSGDDPRHAIDEVIAKAEDHIGIIAAAIAEAQRVPS